MRTWHHRKCGLLFCLAAALFLLGPVKDAISASAANAILAWSETKPMAAIAGNSGTEDTLLLSEQLLGSQRAQIASAEPGADADPVHGFVLPALLPALAAAHHAARAFEARLFPLLASRHQPANPRSPPLL